MKGIDFDVDEYAIEHPECAVWPYMPMGVRFGVRKIDGRVNTLAGRLVAGEIAHICRGVAGRKHYRANVLHLHPAVHRWCDGHGRAGQVLLMFAKWRLAEHDFDLWGRLMTGARSALGWLQTDDVIDACMEWDINELRLQILREQA